MSADKRRKILIGFAGLAVVLVVVITYVSPTFRNENASGAIAPVQKHRAPQIAQGDVVLGNEQVKQQQQILYADFLSDAAALRNLSVEALAVKNLDAIDRLDGFTRGLKNQEANLRAQYQESMTEAAEMAAELAKKSDLDNVEADATALQAMIASKHELSQAEMVALNLKFQGIISELASADAEASLQMVNRDLSQAAEAIEVKSDLESASEHVAHAWSELNALSAVGLQYRLDHLQALAAENKWIENAEETLTQAGSKAESIDNALDEVSATLGKAALGLEAEALANMKEVAANIDAEAALNSAMSATLEKISSLAKNRDSAFDKNLEATSMELRRRAVSRASRHELEVRSQYDAINQHVGSAAKENRREIENLNKYALELKKLASAMP